MAVMRLPGLFGSQYLADSRDTRTSTAPSACGMLPRHAGCVVFIVWEREFLELDFVIQRIFCVFSKVCGLALNIFLAHVSQFYHIVNEGTWRFRRPALTKINDDGS
jgi:hypothetical protein